MDLPRVERELKKRTACPYRWGRKQSNMWDKETNFIYTTYSCDALLRKTHALDPALRDYALNRWYNFWSAMAVEDIFTAHDNVVAHTNSYDKLVDFSIDGVAFDHKTTVFPKGFGYDFAYAKAHPRKLIEWLYQNQSQEGRKHLKNRLFIVLYDNKTAAHWKMKAEIMQFQKAIDSYVKQFSAQKLQQFSFDGEAVYADILWIVNS